MANRCKDLQQTIAVIYVRDVRDKSQVRIHGQKKTFFDKYYFWVLYADFKKIPNIPNIVHSKTNCTAKHSVFAIPNIIPNMIFLQNLFNGFIARLSKVFSSKKIPNIIPNIGRFETFWRYICTINTLKWLPARYFKKSSLKTSPNIPQTYKLRLYKSPISSKNLQ